jgi:hypothetical protein
MEKRRVRRSCPHSQVLGLRPARLRSPPNRVLAACGRSARSGGDARGGILLGSCLVLVLLAALVACSSVAKREAGSLVEAVDRFRRAENPAKPAAANDVRVAACTDAEVCAAKAACLAAIEPTTRALEINAEVERALADLEAKRLAPSDPAARELPKKLDQSEGLLKQGKAAMPACDAQTLALKLKHRL